MRLILVRHAEAVDAAASDFARVLTPKGREQAARVGCFLREHNLRPDHILSSPYLRARETARVIVQQLARSAGDAPHAGKPGSEADERAADLIQEESALGCGMRPEEAMGLLRHLPEDSTVLLVGHQPDCGILTAWLTGTPGGGGYDFRKACTAIFDLYRFTSGGGMLEAFVPVKLT